MKIFGLTIVSSEGDLSVQKENGKFEYCESSTKIFVDKQECIEYAVKAMKTQFESFEFEDDLDYNERSIEEFEEDLRTGDDICIQDCSSHVCFEFFTQDLGNSLTKAA